MDRLSTKTLDSLVVAKPRYDRAAIKPGIVHLGIGAFHRGHQADYTDRLLNKLGGHWGIIAASLRSSATRDILAPQDCLYTLVEQSSCQRNPRVIGVIQSVLVGPEDPEALINTIALNNIKVVTLTITEKGYCHDPSTGAINWDHPDIVHDVANYRHKPKSAIGYLAAAIAKRAEANLPINLLSCDNLSHNGKILQNVVTQFIQRVKPDIDDWVASNVAFPCSMVDRIVPAVTQQDLNELSKDISVVDEAAVFTEPFTQWVIENNFVGIRPQWETVGALLVEDVSAFESIKLRLLNGSHSLMAYLGYVAGFDFVHEAMADKTFNRLIHNFMDCIGASLDIPDGFDVDQYKRQLCARFTNERLQHKTKQIAMDGSLKVSQRWLPAIELLIQQNKPTVELALALAGWFRFLSQRRDDGSDYEIEDPKASELIELVSATKPNDLVKTLLSYKPVFGGFLDGACINKRLFVQQLESFYSTLSTTSVNQLLKTIIT